jgi:MSHA type pilus biogenesis protein MshL
MLYTFRAENLDVKLALAMFARANGLNIVPDLDLAGTVTLDVHDLPLETILEALLDAHGFHWEERNGLIRVHSTQTRVFTVNYPRLVRTGDGYSSASLSGATGGQGGGAGGGGAGGGGGGGGGAGGGGGGGGGGAGGGAAGGAGAAAGSGTSITQQDNIDFWKELETQLAQMVTERGKLVVDKMSGIVQVTDAPTAVNRISEFLELMQSRTQRQVDIEARIYEVVLNNEFQLGVDWKAIIDQPEVAGILAASTIVNLPVGGVVPSAPAIAGTLKYQDSDFEISAIIRALNEQGRVNAISQPRLRSLNNQMAVIKVGTEQPFFNTNSGFIAGNGGSPGGTFQNSTFESITVGTILSLTPQISEDGHITLDISPVISSLVGIESAGDEGLVTAPVLDIKQSSSLIRVKSGETIIIGGLIQGQDARTSRKVPILGDLPVVGLPFRGEFKASRKTELIIFLTPTVVEDLPPGLSATMPDPDAWLNGGAAPVNRVVPPQAFPDKSPDPGDLAPSKPGAKKRRWNR